MQEQKDRDRFTRGEILLTFLAVAVLSTTLFLVTLTVYVLTKAR